VGKVRWVARFVVKEEAVRLHPVSNCVRLCAQVVDLAIINAFGTAPQGVVYIQVPHDNSEEVRTEFG
jgi:hypothetical protein